jgi:hypothetical protein
MCIHMLSSNTFGKIKGMLPTSGKKPCRTQDPCMFRAHRSHLTKPLEPRRTLALYLLTDAAWHFTDPYRCSICIWTQHMHPDTAYASHMHIHTQHLLPDAAHCTVAALIHGHSLDLPRQSIDFLIH